MAGIGLWIAWVVNVRLSITSITWSGKWSQSFTLTSRQTKAGRSLCVSPSAAPRSKTPFGCGFWLC